MKKSATVADFSNTDQRKYRQSPIHQASLKMYALKTSESMRMPMGLMFPVASDKN